MTIGHWPINTDQKQLPAGVTRRFGLILFFSLALLGLQLLSVTHHHHDDGPSLTDTCLICSANSISGAGNVLPGTTFQLTASKTPVIPANAHPLPFIKERPAFFLSRAPPANT